MLIARSLLDANFPESLHHDLCEASGLDIEALEVDAVRVRARQLRRRDPMFRELVLVAYEYRRAVCGYDGRLGTEAVGLDAAHLRWWAFDGPDTVDNGLCLCTFHRKLLDRRMLGISAERVLGACWLEEIDNRSHDSFDGVLGNQAIQRRRRYLAPLDDAELDQAR